MRTNFHTHTPRCGHASGSEEEYIAAAIENGFSALGFSDHSPFPDYEEVRPGTRMETGELEDYVRTVRACGKRHAGEIRILLGLECEYFWDQYGWLRDQIEAYDLDYVIFGNHWAPRSEGLVRFPRHSDADTLRLYVKVTRQALETGMFTYMAHPDMMLMHYPAFDPQARAASLEICRIAKELDVQLEYNLHGVYANRLREGETGLGYPCADFWEIAAREGNRVIVGVDAHRPDELTAEHYDSAEAFLKGLGLEPEHRIRTRHDAAGTV